MADVQRVTAVVHVLQRKIKLMTRGCVWAQAGGERTALSFKELGLSSVEELRLARDAWKARNVLGTPEAPVDGETKDAKRARLLRNLEEWRKKKITSSQTSRVANLLHDCPATSSTQDPPVLPTPPAVARCAAVHASGSTAAQTPPLRLVSPPVPQTLLPPMPLNVRVAAFLASLDVEALIGVELMQELTGFYKIPDEALGALQGRWEAIAEVQRIGAEAEVGTYNNTIAAIFQSWMAALLHSGLACHAMVKEQGRRRSAASNPGKIKTIKVRPAIGGRYNLRREQDGWRLLNEWDVILGGNAKSGCWHCSPSRSPPRT